MPYVSPKDLSVVSSITSSSRTSRNASPIPPPAMTEPVESLAAALAQSTLSEKAVEYESPPALSDCATTSSNSVQTVRSESRDDSEEPSVASPSQPPQEGAEEPESEPLDAKAEPTRVLDEVTVVQDPPPSGTVLDAIPALPEDLDLSKLQSYSRAIYDFTLKLYVRAEKESLRKGHTLPANTPRIAV